MRILNGKVWLNNSFSDKDVLVQGGRIKNVATRILAEEDGEGSENDIDAKGLIVLPGLLDLHVHLREPGFENKEDFRTGTRAAVAGGITHVFDMPNNKVPTTTSERLQEKIKLANGKTACKTSFYLGAAKGNDREWGKISGVKQFCGLKIYMGKTTGDLLVENDKVLETHFANFDPKRPIVVHAEDERGGSSSATEAIEKAGKLAVKYEKQLHIAHITTNEEIEMAKKYPKTTVETCPHYLFIDEAQLKKLGELGGVNPPVRGNAQRVELWKELLSGRIDCLSTDHAPHTLEDKKNGAKGYPGLETSLALMLDAANRKLLPLELVPKLMAEGPARIAGVRDAGMIGPNFTADLTLIDMKKEWVVKGEELETKCKWSPFEGRRLKGKAVQTIVNGKEV